MATRVSKLNYANIKKEFGVGKETLLFRLVGDKANLMMRSVAQRTEDGEVYQLRYSSKEKSPFVQDQAGQVEVGHLIFDNSIIVADKNDPCKQAFLLLHPGCTLNGGRVFRLVNEEKDADEQLAALDKQDEAIALIKETSDEEILRAVLSIMKHIPYEQLGSLKVSRLKLMLRNEVEENAPAIIDAFNSDEVQVVINYYIAKKLDVIVYDPIKGEIKWANGSKIIPVAPGKFEIEEFVRFISTPQGEKVYETIKNEIEK